MKKVEIPDNLIGKFSVESCSYYPASECGSIPADCGTVEVTADGRATLEGFVLPPNSSDMISPFFVAESLNRNRKVINNNWGGCWRIDSIHPGWPEQPSIYLKRGPEEISLHGLNKMNQD